MTEDRAGIPTKTRGQGHTRREADSRKNRASVEWHGKSRARPPPEWRRRRPASGPGQVRDVFSQSNRRCFPARAEKNPPQRDRCHCKNLDAADRSNRHDRDRHRGGTVGAGAVGDRYGRAGARGTRRTPTIEPKTARVRPATAGSGMASGGRRSGKRLPSDDGGNGRPRGNRSVRSVPNRVSFWTTGKTASVIAGTPRVPERPP